jgi:hypothetical protein
MFWRLDSVSVLGWILLSWPHYIELLLTVRRQILTGWVRPGDGGGVQSPKRSILDEGWDDSWCPELWLVTILRPKKKLHCLSPRANYTDRATAASRRSNFQLFADRGCHVVSVTDPLRPYSRFYRQVPLLFYSSSSSVVLTRLSGPRSRPTTFFFW